MSCVCVCGWAAAQGGGESAAQQPTAQAGAVVPPASAPLIRIDAEVVSVSGLSVYCSTGRSAGVVAGARAVFVLADGSRVEGTVIDVSSSSCRAEIAPGATPPSVHDRVEIDAPAPQASPQAPEQPAPIPHAPWARQEGQRTPDQPLLAPAFGTAPEDRPSSVHGRIFTNWRHTRDLENDSNSTYGRVGAWVEAKNLFKDGGRLLFEGDADLRTFDGNGESSSETDARIQRFSYAWGTDQHAPYRVEVGRFYSFAMPEIGVIDGVEGAMRFQSGLALGGGAGLYPLTSEKFSAKDYGLHIFADYQPDSFDATVRGTIGFQQTLHEGDVDRSLLVGRVSARPNKKLTLFGSMLVDIYTGEDDIKSTPADVTQFVGQASYMFTEKTNGSVTLTHTSWPQLKREEYVNLPRDLIADGRVDRLSLSGWHKIGGQFRLGARANVWQDQDRDGYGGELSGEWYQQSPGTFSLYGSVYYDKSAFVDGYGLRLQARKDVGMFRVSGGYDVFFYSQDSFVGGTADFVRNALRADVNWALGKWSFDVEGSYNFGDSENAVSLGVYAQYRF